MGNNKALRTMIPLLGPIMADMRLASKVQEQFLGTGLEEGSVLSLRCTGTIA